MSDRRRQDIVQACAAGEDAPARVPRVSLPPSPHGQLTRRGVFSFTARCNVSTWSPPSHAPPHTARPLSPRAAPPRPGVKRALKHAAMRDCSRRCVYCAVPLALDVATLDHVYPVSHGGPHTPGNLVTACAPCNRLKGDMLPQRVLRAVSMGRCELRPLRARRAPRAEAGCSASRESRACCLNDQGRRDRPGLTRRRRDGGARREQSTASARSPGARRARSAVGWHVAPVSRGVA